MKILLVEDEQELAQSIHEYLTSNEFVCERAMGVEEAADKLSIYTYDCILLDLMLPDGSGFDLLHDLRSGQRSEGIIIITAKEDLQSKVRGLEMGADDYLTKPFHLSEMLARIYAVIRRKKFNGQNVIEINDLKIDLLSKSVEIGGNSVSCTKKELDLLLFLVANKNMVLSKSAIAEHLTGDMADMLDSFDFVYAHIKNLKRKLKEAGGSDYIKTVYGLGYKFHA